MFELSFSEIVVILVVALLIVGPDELPGIIRKFRSFSRKLRNNYKELTDAILNNEETRSLQEEVKALNKDIKRIVDLEGNLQETYDISDFLPETKPNQKDKPPLT